MSRNQSNPGRTDEPAILAFVYSRPGFVYRGDFVCKAVLAAKNAGADMAEWARPILLHAAKQQVGAEMKKR